MTSGADLHYTLNGAEPAPSDPVVLAGGTIAIGSTTTLRIKGFKTGWTSSDSAVASYVFNLGTVSTPTMTPAGGTYTSAQSVTLSTTTAGATIRYTLDGTSPTLVSAGLRGAHHGGRADSRSRRARSRRTSPAAAWARRRTSSTTAPSTSRRSCRPAARTRRRRPSPSSTTTAGATLHYTTTGFDPTESDPTIASGSTVTVRGVAAAQGQGVYLGDAAERGSRSRTTDHGRGECGRVPHAGAQGQRHGVGLGL